MDYMHSKRKENPNCLKRFTLIQRDVHARFSSRKRNCEGFGQLPLSALIIF